MAFGGFGGGGGSTFDSNRSYVAIYRTTTQDNTVDACAASANIIGYAQNPAGGLQVQTFNDIGYGTRIYGSNVTGTQPIADGYLGQYYRGIRPQSAGTGLPYKYISITTGYSPSSYGSIMSIGTCTLNNPPTPTPTPTPVPTPTPTIPAPEIGDPESDIVYEYFTILNESYSKKIFGYYSASADFDYIFSTTTGSGESGPNERTIRLDSGSLGSGDSTAEASSSFLYIDVKDSASQEDIVSYLTQLETVDPGDRGSIRIEVVGSSSYHLAFEINGITTQSISTNGYFELGITPSGSAGSPSGDPISSSLADAGNGDSTTQNVRIKFYNDALLGYHEIEIPGSGSMSFVAAAEQTSSVLPSGSIPGPFNTSWGVSEAEFLADDYYPSSQGHGWMWNDGYKAKHIKLNNRSHGGDLLSSFIRKSELGNFVLYNPKRANNVLMYPSNGNYSEQYILDNVSKYNEYSHLKVDQLNLLTSFAVDSENFAQTDFNLLVDGRYIHYATSSGTVTFPTASTSITQSIPQGYFPATLETEQFFRGWDDANYYINGTLVATSGSINDPLNGFNSGSTERDKDDEEVYVASTLPWFINATASYEVIQSESILEYTDGLTNITQIGPTFEVVGGGQQKYFYKEDTGKIYISGSENIDLKKTGNPLFNTLYDVELVSPTTTTTFYDTGEGFTIEVKPSQSLWLSRGIANPGTQDGDIWKYNRFFHRPYKAYALTSTGSYIKGYSEEVYGEIVYREGPYPVGPPPNEFETIYIAYSSSEAKLRNDGIYTFPTNLTEDITIYADVELDYQRDGDLLRAKYGEAQYGENEYGQEDTGSILTWETASLHLYKNNTIITSSIIHNISESIANGITLEVTRSVSAGGMLAGDKLKLSVEVENTQSGFNAAITVPYYELRIGAPVPPTSDLVPVTFNNSLGLIDDCEPTINNVVGDRPNERLQDVDYSVDVNSPINFDQIIKDEAVRATVPESNFTQLGFANQRYFGSSTSRRKVNEYNELDEVDTNNKQFYAADKPSNLINAGKGPSLGKEPNVELKNGYIAYFNKLIDPYPLVNGKTAYYVKYLIDENGTVFDPTLSDINFSILENTFKLQDYDLEPTRTKVSLQNIEEVKELSKLNEGISPTFKVGQYPVPILYSQTSSLGHTNNIILSGSPFYGTLGLDGEAWSNYGISVNSTQNHFTLNDNGDFRKNTINISATDIYFGSSDITKFDESETIIPTSSFSSGFKVDMPLDANGDPASTSGASLSDDYSLVGTFEFTTTTTPGRYRAKKNDYNKYDDNDLYEDGDPKTSYRQPFNLTFEPFKNGSKSINNFEISSVELVIVKNPGASDEQTYNPIEIERAPSGYDTQWQLSNNEFKINPDSVYLEKRIMQDMLGQNWRNGQVRRDNAHLIGGGYTPKLGSTDNSIEGVNGIAVIYKWKINFRYNNLKQGDDFYFKTKGTFTFAKSNGQIGWRSEAQTKDFFHHHNGGSGFNSTNNRSDHSWAGTFNPDVVTLNDDVTSYNTYPVLTLQVTSPLSAGDQNKNGAPGPYWRRVPNTTDTLYMSSSILNQTYAILDEYGNSINNNYYVQAKLNYDGDINVVFPNTTEPDFIEFDPVQDPWSLQVGDEIRFENKENLVYTITSVDGRQAITPSSNPESSAINDKLQVIVTPPFEFTASNGTVVTKEPSNFDFFVVRRYKENRNFVILDQQTPYGFPVTGSLEPASSPGILLPEHRIEKYDRNPDEVLKDLIEKRII